MILCHDLTSDIYHGDGGSIDADVNTNNTGLNLINRLYGFNIFHTYRLFK